MWNYLKSYFKIGELFKKIFWILLSFATVGGVFFSLPLGLLVLGPAAVAAIKHTAKKFTQDAVVPYWGEWFTRKEIFRLLSGEKFKPYVTSHGETVRQVKVSSSGRWVCIRDRYYPLPLVKRFYFNRDLQKCNVCMIDGTDIGMQEWSGSSEIKDAVTELMGTVADYPKDLCKSAFDAAKDDMHVSYYKLATADWSEFRYLWEQKCRELDYGKGGEKVGKKRIRKLTDPNNIKDSLYNKTLSETELDAICNRIKLDKGLDVRAFSNLDRYQKDIYVLNGVKLCEKLGYPENIKAEDFLFDCIRDIEKPYFDDAIRVLSGFPRKHLISEIERYVEIAHEKGDFVFGAGLLALARSIDYEISLERETEEKISNEVSESSGTLGGSSEAVAQQGAAVAFKIE